jgi:geranylgeranyl transferase type-2 subunit beta
MLGDGFVHSFLKKLRAKGSVGLRKRGERHRRFLLTAFRREGGFPGRAGPPTPYYTLFGLRALFLLGEIPPEIAEGTLSFFRAFDFEKLPAADRFAILFSQSLLGQEIVGSREVLALMKQLRREDGGFAVTPSQPEGSAYGTFLVLESLSMLGISWSNGSQLALPQEWMEEKALPTKEEMVNFLVKRQREDGGFAEVRAVPFGGTSPTAAALAAFRLLEFEDPGVVCRSCEFLARMQAPSGGFRAAFAVPYPDLLSTAVALLVLADRQALDRVSLLDVSRFVESCERPEGGFSAHPAEREPDVEYTLYGLLAASLSEYAAKVG